jgi:hypothetical protein
MLKYSGQVHVRDLALMLEELLYFYRPDGEMLVPTELEFVLSEYDQWVTKNAEPLAENVLEAANALVNLRSAAADDADCENGHSHRTNDGSGFYQQHKLIATMHFGKVAEQLCRNRNPGGESGKSPTVQAASSSKKGEVGRLTSCWSDIRFLIDRASLPNDQEGSSLKPQTSARQKDGAQPKSVAARSAQKRLKLSALRIADATVQFHKFARWIYVVLKTVAEERAEELEYRRALQLHHLLDEGTNVSFRELYAYDDCCSCYICVQKMMMTPQH